MRQTRRIGFITLVSIGLIGFANPAIASDTGNVTVTQVIDGDTLVTSSGTKVRLLGIDAPEKGECGYNEATAKLTRLAEGKKVTLVGSNRDKYDRRLAYVDVNGTDAGAQLIKAGLARPRYNSTDGYGANARDSSYFALAAKTKHVCGLNMTKYTTTNNTNPPKTGNTAIPPATPPKAVKSTTNSCPVKGNINRKGEHIYHVIGGQWYDVTVPERCFQTVAEAIAAGFRASKNG